mgnify:CR=1 FL=1
MTREYTAKLLEMVECGLVDKDYLIPDLLNWLSESDVKEFAIQNEYVDQDEESEEDE